MRKILPVLLAVLIMIAGSWSLLWYMQARQVKQSIEQGIAALSQQHVAVSYSHIETSGFPRQVITTISQPRILLQAADAQSAQLEWQLDGQLVLAVNALSNTYRIETIGNWNTKSRSGNSEVSLVGQTQGPTNCILQLERGNGWLSPLWDWETLTRDFNKLINDFRLLDCNFPAYAAYEQPTQQLVMSAAPGRIYLQRTLENTLQNIRLYVHAGDFEITLEGNTIISRFLSVLLPGSETPGGLAYGKQNFDLDLTFQGPANSDIPLMAATFELHLPTLRISNQIYSMQSSLHIAHKIKGDFRSIDFLLNSQSQAQKAYYEVTRSMLQAEIAALYQPNHPQYEALKPTLAQYTPTQLQELMAGALPDLPSLGAMVQALDIHAQGNSAFTWGDIALNRVDIQFDPYGISASGSLGRKSDNPMPVANTTLICRNCLAMVDDASSYAQRLHRVLAIFAPQQNAPLAVTQEMAQALKQFISALAMQSIDSQQQSLFTYHIISDGSGNATINGRSLDEIIRLYNQYMLPAMSPAP